MTLGQYQELAAYWLKFPPSHLLLRRMIGYKRHETGTTGLGELLSETGDGGVFAKR
jgi:hypothetical protein